MNTKISGVLVVLFIMTIGMTTATATTEEMINEVNLHASFMNVDEQGTSTLITVYVVREYNGEVSLYVGQDIRDQYGDYISGAWGQRVLRSDDLQIKSNLKSAQHTYLVLLHK